MDEFMRVTWAVLCCAGTALTSTERRVGLWWDYSSDIVIRTVRRTARLLDPDNLNNSFVLWGDTPECSTEVHPSSHLDNSNNNVVIRFDTIQHSRAVMTPPTYCRIASLSIKTEIKHCLPSPLAPLLECPRHLFGQYRHRTAGVFSHGPGCLCVFC